MTEDAQDKKHAPTERRLRLATASGDVRRAQDLPKAAVILVFTCCALGAAAGLGSRLANDFAGWLAAAGTAAPGAAAGWAAALALALAPLLLLIGAAATASSLTSGGLVFSLTALKPDFSKLLPAHGLGQLVSPTGISETLKSVLKFLAIGGAGGAMILLRLPDFAALTGHALAAPVLALCLNVLGAICCVLAALAGGDFFLARWLHRQKLRMSDAELREEMRESLGNPQVKQRQRMIARRLARARQMRRIPEASVVVTNPTHFAVAIRYRRGVDRAPLLLAKGVGLLAAEIVSRAIGLGIPVVEAPPLARAMYRHVEPGEPVPVPLYKACAEVLAYVWRMQRWRAQGGRRPEAPPVRQEDIVLPKGKISF